MMTTTHGLFPILFTGWDEGDPETIQLYNVTWSEDWGPFHKGQVLDSLFIDYTKATLTLYNDQGREIQSVKFRCTPEA